MAKQSDPYRVLDNRLLAALPEKEFARIWPHLTPVTLAQGEVLYESGERQEYIYFPTTSLVSLLYIMEDGATAEIGMVGSDGLVGIALLLGGDTTLNRAVVQSAGRAARMHVQTLRAEFGRGGPFQQVLLRYTQALLTQVAQTAVCNRLHTVEAQLCRCLLLSRDRLRSDVLSMTHDLIASMLGVRREGITRAAKRLQDARLIAYARGTITILDGPGLEAHACECYQVVRDEYERLLG
jgi:CRP-like cAMP-binding protein